MILVERSTNSMKMTFPSNISIFIEPIFNLPVVLSFHYFLLPLKHLYVLFPSESNQFITIENRLPWVYLDCSKK